MIFELCSNFFLKNKPGTRGRLGKGLQIPMDGLAGLAGLTGQS